MSRLVTWRRRRALEITGHQSKGHRYWRWPLEYVILMRLGIIRSEQSAGSAAAGRLRRPDLVQFIARWLAKLVSHRANIRSVLLITKLTCPDQQKFSCHKRYLLFEPPRHGLLIALYLDADARRLQIAQPGRRGDQRAI